MIKVLDHGYVRLVSYMQPVPVEVCAENSVIPTYPAGWTGDLEIIRNARTSYNADWRSEKEPMPQYGNAASGKPYVSSESKDAKLINYLYDHRHTTPFEAMVFTFEVQAPIFIFRQWHRHRTWSYNEVSARYTELPELFYVPKPEQIGYQDKKNKQGREGQHEYAEKVAQEIRRGATAMHGIYQELLKAGVTRELARVVLPVNTYSRMFATVDLHNLFHFLTLRLDAHAQYEIRVYAEAILQLIEPICPVAVSAFKGGLSPPRL